ncbi:unnamed protein product [Caretta caretta]
MTVCLQESEVYPGQPQTLWQALSHTPSAKNGDAEAQRCGMTCRGHTASWEQSKEQSPEDSQSSSLTMRLLSLHPAGLAERGTMCNERDTHAELGDTDYIRALTRYVIQTSC